MLEKQHSWIPTIVDTRDTVWFDAPAGRVETTFAKTGELVFSYHNGTQPFALDGPLVVVDLEDAAGPDGARYAVEITYTYDSIGVAAGDFLTGFEALGGFQEPLGGWTQGDRMLGGYWHPFLSPLNGEVPGCDPDGDDQAYRADGSLVQGP